jgi:hypothetical protein
MDKYTLNARIYPVVILLLPIIIIGVSYSIEYDSLIQTISSLGITSALLYFFSNLGRDNGKLKEPKLWSKWGGMPTVQLLSFKNEEIDPITKRKYHKILLELSPIEDKGLNFETTDIHLVSNIYEYWTTFLISRTRNTKKFPLIFKENISYGFRRNLWGLKNISILFLIISISGNILYQFLVVGSKNLLDFPISFFISELFMIIILLIWIFRINSEWIRIPAFAYAERLLESVEEIKAT